jgi:hypothetical protein
VTLTLRSRPLLLAPVSVLFLSLAGAAGAACDVKVGEGGISLDVAHGEATDEWTRTYTLPKGGMLEVVGVNGSIDVFPSKTGKVELTAKRRIRTSTPEEATAALKNLTMEEEVSPDSVRVVAPEQRREGEGPFNNRSLVVEYRIGIPEGLEVSLKTQNGRIEVEGVNAKLAINSTNGGVTVRNLSGTLQAETVNGGMQLDLASLDGDTRVETVNGGVRVDLPSEANAAIDAQTVNGGVSVDDAFRLTTTTRERTRVIGQLNDGGPLLWVRTVNGGVRIDGRAGSSDR